MAAGPFINYFSSASLYEFEKLVNNMSWRGRKSSRDDHDSSEPNPSAQKGYTSDVPGVPPTDTSGDSRSDVGYSDRRSSVPIGTNIVRLKKLKMRRRRRPRCDVRSEDVSVPTGGISPLPAPRSIKPRRRKRPPDRDEPGRGSDYATGTPGELAPGCPLPVAPLDVSNYDPDSPGDLLARFDECDVVRAEFVKNYTELELELTRTREYVWGGRANEHNLVTRDALRPERLSVSGNTIAPGPIVTSWAKGRKAGAVERVPWCSALLDGLAPGDLPEGSALFYALAKGRIGPATVARSITTAARKKSPVNFIVWVNSHWVTTQLIPGVSWKIYDSARTPHNEKDLKRWAEDIGLPVPTFPNIPQQRPHSFECGIFAFLMLARLQSGRSIPVLRTLPKQLMPQRPTLKKITRLVQDPEAAYKYGWEVLDQYYKSCEEVEWTNAAGDDFDDGAHLRVKWHYIGKPERHFDERAIVTEKFGTARRTSYFVSFEAASELSNQKVVIPPPAGSNIVVLSYEIDDRPEEPPAPASDSESEEEAGAMSEEEHHRFYEEFLRETRVETFLEPSSTASTGLRPLTVGEFMLAKIRPLDEAREVCPVLVWTAMVTETRRGHIRELTGLQDYVKTLLPKDYPLDMAIARYAEEARRTRNLSWSSVSRILQTLIGAFAVFPNYATGETEEFPPIFISKWPGIRDSLKTAKRLSNVVGTREPVAAKAVQVSDALEHLSSHDQVFLQLCWITSQRPGDVVHVRSAHVQLLEDKAVIRFAEGKNHAATDQYAIHCVVPSAWIGTWRHLLGRGKKFLFDVPTKSARASLMRRVREALRKTPGGKELEMKSLRRGSLQTMAENGASVAELLKFSRHQDAKTLRRYLAFDTVADAENQGALEHTRILGAGPAGIDGFTPEPWCTIMEDGDIHFGPPPKPRTKMNRSGYKYHIKDVSPVDLDALSRLASSSSETVREDWEKVKRFLLDPQIYEEVEKGPPLRSRIRRKMIRELERVGQIKEVTVTQAKNFCAVFVIPEDEKFRWRIIKHPRDINSALKDIVDDLEVNRTNATRRDARLSVVDYPGCLEFDFAGYFDQFLMKEEVAEHFVFHDGRGYYAPKRLPMGASFSVAVATAATRVLVDGIAQGLDVSVSHQIDNVRIAGTKENCLLAAKRFLGRCQEAGVTINEYDLDTLYGTTNDFMGDEVDFAKKTIRCRVKQQDRLKRWMAKVSGEGATFRDWFACYGTAAYMAEALGITPAQHFQVRLFMRTLARAVSKSHVLWDERMLIPPPWPAWNEFMAKVCANEPATIVAHPREVVNVFVDASNYGAGALSLGPNGARAFMPPRRWTEEERKEWAFELSTVAEPRALIDAVKWASRSHPGAAIHVFSDHRPFVDAFWRCGSFSPGYNNALLELGGLNVPVVLHHIAGEQMPADGMSRGTRQSPSEEDWSHAAEWVDKCALSNKRYYRIIGGGIGARTFAAEVLRNPHTKAPINL